MKRKILSIVLSCVMVFSTTGFVFADTEVDNSTTETTKIEKEIKQEQPKEEVKQEESTQEQATQQETEPTVEQVKKAEATKKEATKEEVKEEVNYPISITWVVIKKSNTGLSSTVKLNHNIAATGYKKFINLGNSSYATAASYEKQGTTHDFKYWLVSYNGKTKTFDSINSKIYAIGADSSNASESDIKVSKNTTITIEAIYDPPEVEFKPYTVTYNMYYRSAGHGQIDGWVKAGTQSIEITENTSGTWNGTQIAYKAMVDNNVSESVSYNKVLYTFTHEWKDEERGRLYTEGKVLDGKEFTEDAVVNIYAQYTEKPLYGVTINYIDNIGNGSHSWSTGPNTPLEKYSSLEDEGVREPADHKGYIFKYWHCEWDNINYKVGDDFVVEQKDLPNDNFVINLYAVYQKIPTPIPTPKPHKPDPTTPKVEKTTTEFYYGMGDGKEYTPITVAKTPFTAPKEIGAWALVNLLTVIVNFAICILLFLMVFINNRKEDDEIRVKNKIPIRIDTAIIAIISAIIFFLTENMSLPMIWVDKWTIPMIILLIIQIVLMILCKHKEIEKEIEE